MNLPPISVVVITYNRPDEIRRTLRALDNNMVYNGAINWIIADDCSPAPYSEDVLRWCPKNMHLEHYDTVRVITPPQNSGWGANANTALSQVDTDIVLVLEDDYVLTTPINLDPLVALLLENDRVGTVRLDGIAGHRVLAHHAECNVSVYCPNYAQGVAAPGMVHYWVLDNGSPELWLYSNRPALRHKRFFDYYGKYAEGLKLGATEEDYAHRVKDKMRDDPDNAPWIVTPLDANSYFQHIGHSYQHSEHDKGK